MYIKYCGRVEDFAQKVFQTSDSCGLISMNRNGVSIVAEVFLVAWIEGRRRNFDKEHLLNVLYQFSVFRADPSSKDDRRGFWLSGVSFDFSFTNSERNSTKFDKNQILILYQIRVFGGR